MCNEATALPTLENTGEIEGETIVVALRGVCTFGEKSNTVSSAGAAGIVFVNNKEGLFHPSGPDFASNLGYFSAS